MKVSQKGHPGSLSKIKRATLKKKRRRRKKKKNRKTEKTGGRTGLYTQAASAIPRLPTSPASSFFSLLLKLRLR